MSVAYTLNGEPISLPPAVVAFRAKRLKPKGPPEPLYDADGIPLVLPIDFTKLFWASLIGYVFFGQVPEIWIWIGAMVVFAAVFYNAYRERGTTP